MSKILGKRNIRIPREEEKIKFLYGKSWCTICLEEEILQLNFVKSENKFNPSKQRFCNIKIDIYHIISTSFSSDKWKVDQYGEPLINSNIYKRFQSRFDDCFTLIINYWSAESKGKRKAQSIKLHTYKKNCGSRWSDLIDEKLQEVLKIRDCVRPHSLLVFVNPFGGKRKAGTIYEKTVAPLFETAGIRSNVIHTEYAGHAKEYIETEDVSSYDGIVVVGGDGTLSEVVNGVLNKEQKEQDIPLDGEDVHKKSPSYASSKIKIGIIPGGSANCINYTLRGNDDPETAAIQIICGESLSCNVCSVHNEEAQFIQFNVLFAGYGFLTQLLQRAGSLRHLGPVRYDVGLACVLMKHLDYPCEISFLESSLSDPVDVAKETSKCSYPCNVCSDESIEHVQEESQWKVVRGNFHWVTVNCNAGMYNKSPGGYCPSAHLNDGTVDVILVQSPSRKDLFKFLFSLRNNTNQYDLSYVEGYRVKGFRIRPVSKKYCLSSLHQKGSASPDVFTPVQPLQDKEEKPYLDNRNTLVSIDGECMNVHGFTTWAHRGLITMFATGIQKS